MTQKTTLEKKQMAKVPGNKLFNSNEARFLNNINIKPLTLEKNNN